MVNGRRSNIQIIAEILKLGEAGKTEIMYSVNMSYAQLEKYLDFLVEKGFMTCQNGTRPAVYRITPKGRRLLREIEKVMNTLGVEMW